MSLLKNNIIIFFGKEAFKNPVMLSWHNPGGILSRNLSVINFCGRSEEETIPYILIYSTLQGWTEVSVVPRAVSVVIKIKLRGKPWIQISEAEFRGIIPPPSCPLKRNAKADQKFNFKLELQVKYYNQKDDDLSSSF